MNTTPANKAPRWTHRTLGAAVALAVSLIGGSAFAQSAPNGLGPVAQPVVQAPRQQRAPVQFAPANVQGNVVRFVLGPMGRVRALVLNTGAVVMLGHDGEAVATRAGVGSAIRAQGFASTASPTTIMAATIMDASGAVISQPNPRALARVQGQPPQGMQGGMQRGMHHGRRGFARGQHAGRGHRGQAMARMQQLPMRSANGTVQTLIAGPRGHVRGVLLSDGTSVMFSRDLSRAATAQGLAVGQTLRVQGHGDQYARGVAMLAQQVTFANGVTVASVPQLSAPVGS